MTTGKMARRYAAALFDVTRRNGTGERAGRELSEFAGLVDGHAELGRVLASPGVPASAKRAVIAGLLDKAGDVTPEVRRVVTMLADRDRLGALGSVAGAFAELLLEEQRVVRADVVTATPLSAASRAALGDALSRATGKTVTLNERVDPAIVGGIVARVGSLVYDGSVTRQLERLRDKLTQGT